MDLHERSFVVIFVLILLGELNVAIQPYLVEEVSVDLIDVKFNDGKGVEVDYHIKQGTYPYILKAALLQTCQPLIDKDLYVYYDKEYPSSYVSPSGWIGIVDHLEENKRLKEYKGNLEIVNALRLKEIMQQRFDSIVVIPSGVLPDTVHTTQSSLIKQYLEKGGIIVWVGDVFAAYSGARGGRITTLSAEDQGLQAQRDILGYVLSNASEFDTADKTTSYAEALSLRYSGIHAGISTEQVVRHEGLVLGKTKGNVTSIGMVPVGNGFLIVFGGKVSPARSELGEDFVASDIINILLSGAIYSSGQLSYAVVQRKDALNQTLTISINDEKSVGAVFLILSDDYYSYFVFRQFLARV